jgi:hypothetical protein
MWFAASPILGTPSAGVKELPRTTTMATPPFPAPPGRRWVFAPWFVHYRTGKRVYPKTAKCFCFLVRK